MIRAAKEEAQKILRDAKDTADQTIRNINKLAADSGVNKELEEQRSRLRSKLQDVDSSLSLKKEKKQPGKRIDPKKLKLGDGVKVLSMNLNGTVSSLPNAKGDLYVQMGILRSLVNLSDLELLHEESVSTPATSGSRRSGSGSSSTRISKSFTISPEINLIGMTTDEAIPQLDKYLDDAYLAHLPQVRVVHGRGTGALKKCSAQALKEIKICKGIPAWRLWRRGFRRNHCYIQVKYLTAGWKVFYGQQPNGYACISSGLLLRVNNLRKGPLWQKNSGY